MRTLKKWRGAVVRLWKAVHDAFVRVRVRFRVAKVILRGYRGGLKSALLPQWVSQLAFLKMGQRKSLKATTIGNGRLIRRQIPWEKCHAFDLG